MKPRVLMICPYPPAPPTSGRAIRMLYLIEGLSRDAVIDLIMNDTGPIAEADMTRLKACCRRVCVAPHRQRSKLSQLPHIVGKVLRGEPFDTKYAEGPELTRMVRDMATNGAYESIVVEESRMAMALMALPPNHGARTVLAMNDVAYVQIRSICRRERNPYEKLKQFLTWWPMRTWEPLMASRFDIVVTVSESDRRLLLARRSGLNVVVVPNGVDTKLYRPVPREGRKERMLFVGALDYSPNVDAAKFLGRDILPRVLEKRPHSACVIVGRAPGRKVKDLANLPGVTIEGDVADVRPYYASAAVAVTRINSRRDDGPSSRPPAFG